MSSPESTTKIVLITGANTGIGYAVAKGIASQNKGYHVLIGSRDTEKGIEAAATLQKEGLSVEAITIDVTVDASIFEAVETVTTKFGRLDILINNAGIAIPAPDSSLRSEFEQVYSVNTFGAAVTTESFLPLLEKSSSANIVFVSSALGSLTMRANPENKYYNGLGAVYRSSKAALNMLALHYAKIGREKGWRVNTCTPGLTKSSLAPRAAQGHPVEVGAKVIIWLATLGKDGPTAGFWEGDQQIPW